MSAEISGESKSYLHKIYTSDPILFKNYVNKKVSITTEDSNVHTGIVYTVDPVSESFVLMQPEEDEKKRIKIIMRQAIKNIDCSYDTEVVLPEMFVPSIYSKEVLKRRKNAVMVSLKENCFTLFENKNIIYTIYPASARIEPPYKLDNCDCSNDSVLKTLQMILVRISD